MFTGIIEEIGTVASLEARSAGARLVIECQTVLEDAHEGSSIAVNGVCLTALALTPNSLPPTSLLKLSHAPTWAISRRRARESGTPRHTGHGLCGHIVQGHVDATGELMLLRILGDGNWWLKLRVPRNWIATWSIKAPLPSTASA